MGEYAEAYEVLQKKPLYANNERKTRPGNEFSVSFHDYNMQC